MKIPIFPGKYHQNGGFSMAMLVYRGVPACHLLNPIGFYGDTPGFAMNVPFLVGCEKHHPLVGA